MSSSSSLIYDIRAKDQGQRTRHQRTRLAFLDCVVADARTRNLFSFWGQTHGFDKIVEDFGACLDTIARREGFAHRSKLRDQLATVVTDADRAVLDRFAQQLDLWRVQTHRQRLDDALFFISTGLYKRPPTFVAPLAEDLLGLFAAELVGHIWDTQLPVVVPYASAGAPVPNGLQPKDGGHVERHARWNYRHIVQDPPVSDHQLAEEWRIERREQGINLGSKDKKSGDLRADTKAVRKGIAEAQKLLELPTPPWEWPKPDIMR